MKKIFTLLTLFALLPMMAWADDSGTCGENVTWTYEEATKTLTISGIGAMADYDWNSCPWGAYRSDIQNLIIETGITVIGDWAFTGCYMTSVTIPNGVTSIHLGAFNGCYNLTSVYIPDGVTYIGNGAFQGCGNLESIRIPSNEVTLEPEIFLGCNKLYKVNFSNIKAWLNNTYYFFGATENIHFFLNDEEIHELVIPSDVTSIRENAFTGFNSLNRVILESSTPPTVFDNSFPNYDIKIRVPEGSLEAYKAHDVWKNFTDLKVIKPMHKLTFILDDQVYQEQIIEEDEKLTPQLTTINEGLVVIWENWPETMPDHDVTLIGKKYSGTQCGGNAVCTYNETTKTLTISGTGEMFDYYDLGNLMPWSSFRNEIIKIVIEEGINSIGNCNFWGCSNLVQVILPNSLKRIGYNSFMSCNNLLNISLNDGLLSIESSAFSGCSSLTSMTIPANVKIIEYGLFQGCSGIQSISIPEQTSSIGRFAFSGCSSLTSLIIPDNVTSIEGNAFEGCSNLTSITLPASLTSLGESAFSNCEKLSSINLPNGLSSIADNTFIWCYELTSISLPNGLTSIGSNAFRGCSSLSSINLPENLSRIGEGAFSNCSNLSSITIPSGVTNIGTGAFRKCSNLATINLPSGLTCLEEGTFYECTNLTKIDLPNQLYNIKAYALYGCSNITSISIPSSVEYIYQNAFTACSSLEKIIVESSNPPFIYNNTFSNYDVPVRVPEGSVDTYKAHDVWKNFTDIQVVKPMHKLTYILDGEVYKEYMKEEGEALTKLTPSLEYYEIVIGWDNLPETMPDHDVTLTGRKYVGGNLTETIDWRMDESTMTLNIVGEGNMPNYDSRNYNSAPWNMLFGKNDFKSLSIGEGITSVGEYAFNDMTELSSVILPSSLTRIGGSSFGNCTKLSSLQIPANVKVIEGGAFKGCTNLSEVSLPYGLTAIGNGAFSECKKLTTVILPETLEYIDKSAFYGCEGINTLTIPGNIQWIDEYSFYMCSGLTSLIIKEGIVSIDDWAFAVCSNLKHITLPSTINKIKDFVFTNCPNIETITILSVNPPEIGNNTFDDINYSSSLNVPDGSYSAYKNHPVWGRFTRINDNNTYYQLSLTSAGHGKVTYSEQEIIGGNSVFDIVEGNNAVITITPDANYAIQSVTVNGVDKTAEVTNGTLTLAKITENTTVSVQFGTSGDALSVTLTSTMATVCATEDLDFTNVSGLEAYIGSGFNRTTGVLLMTRVYDVPAGTGLVLKGTAGTYEIPYAASPSVYVNMLEGVTSATTISQTSGGYTNYILAEGTNGTGFYLVSGTGEIAAGKAYLRVPSASAARITSIALDFSDGTTGINGIEADGEDVYYSLSGQRIEGTPQQAGVYVKNGRKVVIK